MPKLLDLFSGCGGLTLGSHRAGFETALAVDFDPVLTSSFAINFPSVRLENTDIRNLDVFALKPLLGKGMVDGVIGGPPCQAFSEMGKRHPDDPRRTLVHEFFRVVAAVQPRFFVFENVRGLGFANNLQVLEHGLELLGGRWKIVGPVLLDASDFGVPTRRVRIFLFGFNPDTMEVPLENSLVRKSSISVNVRDAISDLSGSRALGRDELGFETWAYGRKRNISQYANSMRAKTKFTGHMLTSHSAQTIDRLSKVLPGRIDSVGRYPRLEWEGLSPTLRAGTGPDKGSFQAVRPLHPEENRVITPREAARLQGFPDEFLFHPTIWHSCRMIGNSVSPVLAEVLLRRIRRYLSNEGKARRG